MTEGAGVDEQTQPIEFVDEQTQPIEFVDEQTQPIEFLEPLGPRRKSR